MQSAGLISCLVTAVLTAGYLFTPMSVLLSAASGLAAAVLCSGTFFSLQKVLMTVYHQLNKGDIFCTF